MSEDHLLTAEEARRRYAPSYTLEEILAHVARCADDSHRIRGYDPKRLPYGVQAQLIELGYQVTLKNNGYEIRWSEDT